MRVVFLQDMPNVAKAGEIKEVADGYGRNYLVPRRLALPASAEAIKTVAAQLEGEVRRQAKTEAGLVGLANRLNGQEVSLAVRVGGEDRLYGAVTAADIAAGLESLTGITVDKRRIELSEPIRQVGTYEIAIRLAQDIVPKIKVTVSGKTT